MEQLNPIDDIFKELNADVMEPSSKVWGAIEADQRRKKKGALMWLWTIPAIAVLTLGYIFWPQENKQVAGTPKPEQVQMAQNTAPEVDAAQNEPIQPQVETVIPTPAAATPTQTPALKQTQVQHSLNANKESVSETATATVIEKLSNDLAALVSNGAEINEANAVKETLALKEESAIPAKQETAVQKNETNKRITPKDKHNPFYVEGDLFLGRTFRALNGANDHYIALRNGSEISLIRPAIVVKVGYDLTKKLAFQAGLGYVEHNISASYIYSPDKTIYDSATGTTTVIAGSKAANGDQSYKYIRMPLLLEYVFGAGRLDCYVSSGFSVNALVKSTGFIQNIDNQQAGNLIAIKQQPIRRVGMDAVLRAGTILPVWKNYSIVMGATFNYGLLSAFKDVFPVKQHNFSYGLELGLRYHLGK
jgi:hypothetical protein